MKFEAEVVLRGQCKHCGKMVELYKPFLNHLAYEHGIYKSKIYKYKAMVRKLFIK